MKFLIVLVALFAVAAARPQREGHYDLHGHQDHHDHHEHHDKHDHHEHAEILKLDSDVQKDGYQFILETSDGTIRKEEGVLKEVGKEHEHAIVVHGTFSYKDKHGEVYTVDYVADEHGFQPEGKHLPQLPKIVL